MVALVPPSKVNATFHWTGLDTNGVQGERTTTAQFALVGADFGAKMIQLGTDVDAFATLLEAASKGKISAVTISYKEEPSSYAVPVEAELWQEAVISVRLEGLGQKIGTFNIPAPADAIITPEGAVAFNNALVTAIATAYKVEGESGTLNALISDGENVRGANYMEGGVLRYRSRKGR